MENEYNKDRKQAIKDETAKVPFYYLKKGKTIIRVLPPFDAEGVWFKEYHEHRLQLGGKTANFTCARPFGGNCVICDKGEQLSEAGESSFKDFQPKRAYLFNVIVLSDSAGTTAKEGVKVLKSGITVKKGFLELECAFSEGYGNITSITEGFMLAVERTGDGVKDTRYSVKPFRDRTNLVEVLKAQNVDPSNFTQFNLKDAIPAPRPVEEMLAAIEGKARVFGFPAVAVGVGVTDQVAHVATPAVTPVTVAAPIQVSGISIVPAPEIPEPPSA